MSRLLVFGGSGFIGQRVCAAAVHAGHDVRSVSRRGRPSTVTVNEPPKLNGRDEDRQNRSRSEGTDWVQRVEWIAADVFDPSDWRKHLVDCDGVVHSIGITNEAPAEGRTFERINGDSTIIAALEAERAGVDAFAFVSVSAKPPGLPERYLTAKRRAERAIKDLDLRVVALRPGPVYGRGNPHFPSVVGRALEVLDRYDGLVSRFGPGRPLSVETVATTALRAALDPAIAGILDIPTIEEAQPPIEL